MTNQRLIRSCRWGVYVLALLAAPLPPAFASEEQSRELSGGANS